MASFTPSNRYSDANDSKIDLEKVFSHPDGLPVARSLVADLIQTHQMEMSNQYGQTQARLPFPISKAMGESNPEIPTVLKKLLAFSEPEAYISGMGTHSTMKVHDQIQEAPDQSHVRLSPTFLSYAPLDTQLVGSSRGGEETEASSERRMVIPDIGHAASSGTRYPSNSLLLSNSPRPNSSSSSDLIFGEDVDLLPRQQLPSISQLDRSSSDRQHTLSSSIAGQDRQRLPTIRPTIPQRFSKSELTPQFSNSQVQTHPQYTQPRSIYAKPPQNAYPQTIASHSVLPSQALLPNRQDNSSVSYSPIQPHPQFNGQLSNNRPQLPSTNRQFTSVQLDRANSRSWTPIQSRIPDFVPSTHTTLSSTKMSAKRKNKATGEDGVKKQRTAQGAKKRVTKPKADKKDSAKYKLDQDIWMRILEFTPPSFLGKARLISKSIKTYIDARQHSIYKNNREENFGPDMPPAPNGLSDIAYSKLLGDKGCMEPGCGDKHASRVHWSWAKRWCMSCWKSKIEREDRAIKSRMHELTKPVIERLVDCIPFGMHDSFMKPHDVDLDERTRSAPRLYKYFLTIDIQKVISDYQELTPTAPVDDPAKTAEENSAAQAAYQTRLASLPEAQLAWIAERKAVNDDHMEHVKKIEAGVRSRRVKLATPYNKNRQDRRDRFLEGAKKELGQIPLEFVQKTKAFRAATRIFRDGGSIRGWQTLKPKILKEWLDSEEAKKAGEGQAAAAGTANTSNAEGSEAVTAATTPAADTDVDRLTELGFDGDDQHEETSRDEDHMQIDTISTGLESRNSFSQPFTNTLRSAPTMHGSLRASLVMPGQNTSSAFSMNAQASMNGLASYGLPSMSSSTTHSQASMSGASLNNGFFSQSVPQQTGTMATNGLGYNGSHGLFNGPSQSYTFNPATMANSTLGFGRQGSSISATMLSRDPAVGHHQGSYVQSYQQGMNMNASSLPAMSENPNARMSISSLLTNPPGVFHG